MDERHILDLYDEGYAASYNDKFIFSDNAREDAEFEVRTIDHILGGVGPWLDVACGTGYFLSRFPTVERAGLDISPSMLAVAKRANPDVSFHQRDFRDPIPEWRDAWRLVSCLWYAYGLTDSMADVHRVLDNLVSWTASDGVCYLPVSDPRLITGVDLPSEVTDSPWPGGVRITGIVWTYDEGSEGRHENMVAPQLDYLLEFFEQRFDRVELVDYPSSRQAIVARGKKTT